MRAFYNTCQHRGAPVVRDTTGTARTLRCQYHSWTYDITEGELVAVPDERDFVGLDKATRCLPPLRCEIWDSWIFVNQDLEAVPLLEWMAPIPEQLAELQGPSLRQVATRSEVVPCNWKVTAEAFLEVYHFRHIHQRDGESHLDNRGATMGLLPNGSSRMITPFSKASWAAFGMERLGRLAPLRDAGVRRHPDGQRPGPLHELGVLDLPQPDHADRRLRVPVHHVLADRQADDADRLDPLRARSTSTPRDGLPAHWERRMENFDQIMDEDFMNMAPMQRSLESPAFRGMPINYQERRIWHFNEQLDRVIGIERIPEELRVEQLLARYVGD